MFWRFRVNTKLLRQAKYGGQREAERETEIGGGEKREEREGKVTVSERERDEWREDAREREGNTEEGRRREEERSS